MCGRYTLTYSDLGAVAELLGAIVDEGAAELHRPRYNVAPTNGCVIALPGEESPVLVPAIWGMRLGGRLVINMRGENAASRMKDAYANGRCIVPADGFYEWTGEQGERRPVWFHAKDEAPLFMAGLVRREKEDPSAPPAFVVLTGPAEPPIDAIHDRMPVLLTAEHAQRWLARAPKAVKPDPIALVGTAVSPRVNSVAHDDPACLEPAGDPKKQLSLF